MVSVFCFQFPAFRFPSPVCTLEGRVCHFSKLQIAFLYNFPSFALAVRRPLCNFQIKYFPNAIHFCANCFLCLPLTCLLPRLLAFLLLALGFLLASVWAFHLAKSYLKLVKHRQTEITHFGNWKSAERQKQSRRLPTELFFICQRWWFFLDIFKGDGYYSG